MSLSPVWVGSKRSGKAWSGSTGRKLVLHTLEFNGWPYPQRWDHPSHFVFNPWSRELRQYIDTEKAAYSIRSSDIENDFFTLQVELWGKASLVPGYNDLWYSGVAELVEWVSDSYDVPVAFGDFSDVSYGRFASQRMTDADLRAFSGVVGHCHVGLGVDTHWDPGELNVGRVKSFMVAGDIDMSIVIEALKAQDTGWYSVLQEKTGTPAGDPSYWGDGRASDAEWVAAAPALLAAALQAGVLGPFGVSDSGVDVVARGQAGRANTRLDGIDLSVPG